ncbi:glycosyltransferase family 2 protein [Nesterenkonia lutea]|uniref:Glycosyltransferase involved in cell wall biosynthesis n=1 Tax=Nesterenkonia lutea TaxID=272919 RepID=A0ABR9JBV5_9MICC|nr:glycosyltransferase family A protein [Nesterenkonia lutea]MBE1523417.1 glycosyltransferase involved in cell wall biosynthesis [Nesterenkonia lutea]
MFGTLRRLRPYQRSRPSPSRIRADAGAPLVTVGITSHNDAEKISRCLESVAAQTLGAEHIEVLVVDDGSKDKTFAAAREHEHKASWAGFAVRQHRASGSPSKGRNTIMDEAAGEFVFFVDADDYLGPEALQAMTQAAKKRGADIVVGRYVGVNRSAPNVLEPREPAAARDYHSGWLNSLHVQKLFRTAFIRGLDYRFNESLIYASDHPFMISAFLHAERVAMVEDVDCYFLTMDSPEAETTSTKSRVNVSRAEIPAKKQLQFLHDCFGILALGRGQGGRTSTRAGKMRADYWNRLLKLHLPMLLLRKDDDAAIVELAQQALGMAELYGAQTQRSRLTDGAQMMLDTLREATAEDAADGGKLTAAAQRVRTDVRGTA